MPGPSNGTRLAFSFVSYSRMVIIHWTFTPGPRGLRPLLGWLGDARARWARVNGPGSAGRVLTPYSGARRAAVWELRAASLADHDAARDAWTRSAPDPLESLD